MKRSLILLATLSLGLACTQSPTSSKNSPTIEKNSTKTEELSDDCLFHVEIYHPRNSKVSPFEFCLYNLRVERGIFAATTCVGVLIEPKSQTRNPFYGSNGHWGVEGTCNGEKLRKKILEPEIDKTVNPITSLRIKRKEGMKMRLLHDDFKLWDLFQKRTQP